MSRSPELSRLICELVSESKPHRTVAHEAGCSPQFIRDWIKDDAEFAANYALAKNDFAEEKFDELITLADSAIGQPPEVVNAMRLAVDTRKWVISKLLPKKYGDKPADISVSTIVHNHISVEEQKQLQERHQKAVERMKAQLGR